MEFFKFYEVEEPSPLIGVVSTTSTESITSTVAVTTVTEEEVTETTVEIESTTAEIQRCDQCDINNIAPDLADPNTFFEPYPQNPVDGCLRTYASCRRLDNLICATVEMFAETPSGLVPIGDGSTLTVVFATFSCAEDGTYSWMSITEISKLSCVWTTCF